MTDVKVKVLENFGREAVLRKKWVRTWEKLGERILKLPKWMQTIILEDVNTAITNRIATRARRQGRVDRKLNASRRHVDRHFWKRQL
jgi:hypothetical protein